MQKKIITVFGATGGQGGGLARAILRDVSGGFSVRAVTRNPNSDPARTLAAGGAEVVRADLDDAASVEQAMAGAYGAFCLTNFWEHFSPQKETAQGRTMAEAARKTGVEHVVWSTFEETRKYIPLSDDRMPTLQEAYKVPHFDAKADADQYFDQPATTFLYTSGYMDNLIHFGWGPQKGDDGSLFVVYPMDDVKLPLIAVEDIGKCTYGVFQRPEEYRGKTVGVAGDHVTGSEIAAALSDALNTTIVYNAVPPDVYRTFDFPGADDIGNMFQFKRDCAAVYQGHRNLDESRRLNPELQTLQAWLAEHASRIPMP